MSSRRTLARPLIWGAYVVIVLEFLFMISPFALYFYSSYGPALNVLHRSPATSWLTGFFLPHFSYSETAWLGWTKPAGFLLAGFGLLWFLAGAVQIYGAKLLKRREVTGGLYRFSRHPQYTALAVLGLGVVLIWPRFLVLVAYVTMLVLYVLLARWEEDLCLEKYGDGYRKYMNRTGRFLPHALTAWIPLPRVRVRAAVLPGIWLAAVALAVLVGLGLREASLSRISASWQERQAILSPAVLAESELLGAYALASRAPEVSAARAASRDEAWLVYVVPESWYLADLPLHGWFELADDKRSGHITPADFDRDRYKVLITRPRTHRRDAVGRGIVRSAYGRDPLFRVHVDLAGGEVIAVETPPSHVVWGDIPTPLF
jgi:protein-S-isoprenylcysteine O-methyltransferase Ste14